MLSTYNRGGNAYISMSAVLALPSLRKHFEEVMRGDGWLPSEAIDKIVSELPVLHADRCACTTDELCKFHADKLKVHDQEIVNMAVSAVMRRLANSCNREQILHELGLGE
jgi:hypothetical protein